MTTEILHTNRAGSPVMVRVDDGKSNGSARWMPNAQAFRVQIDGREFWENDEVAVEMALLNGKPSGEVLQDFLAGKPVRVAE